MTLWGGAIRRWLYRRIASPTARERVYVDAARVILSWKQRGDEAVEWVDVTSVGLRITSSGHSGDAFFIYLIGARQRLVIGSGAQGIEALLDQVCALPGLNKEAFQEAARSPEPGWFIVWQRP